MPSDMSGPSWRGGLYCCLAAALFFLAAADERSHKVRPDWAQRCACWQGTLLCWNLLDSTVLHCRSSSAQHVALSRSMQYSVAEPVRIWVNKAGPYNK